MVDLGKVLDIVGMYLELSDIVRVFIVDLPVQVRVSLDPFPDSSVEIFIEFHLENNRWSIGQFIPPL